MKHNWRPSKPAFIDFETQSEAELTTTHKYASHPSTRVLCCCVKADGKMYRVGPYLDASGRELLARIAAEHTLVAHNAPFDSAIWTAANLPDAEWCDTLPMARAAGYPGKLDELGKIIAGEGKDKNGKRLIDLLCVVRNGRTAAVGPAHQLLLDYCEKDVELLEAIYGRVKGYGEPDVMSADYTINQRGVPMDRRMVLKLKELYVRNEAECRGKFDELTDGANPKSAKQVRSWLLSQGFAVDSVQKAVVKDLLADPDRFYIGDADAEGPLSSVKDALEMRREVAKVGGGKLDAALRVLEDDGRVREQFVYWGAGPGRWSGRTLQLHNMPTHLGREADLRAVELTYESLLAVTDAASAKCGYRVARADVLSSLIRHAVRTDNMLVADYAGVEARCAAWVSRDPRALALYNDPSRSIYLDMGQQVFGVPVSKKDKAEYALAKALVLGCMYGMSGVKFELLCKTRSMRTETLDRMGMSAAQLVKVYRNTYSRIPQVWREYNDAMHAAVAGSSAEAGRCKFYSRGSDAVMELPSGRCVVYRNARVEMQVPLYQKLYGLPEEPVPTVAYDSPRGHPAYLYGSKICENACQGICRDLLAAALVRYEELGFRPFIHVHDEIGCEMPEAKFAEFMEVMSTPPAWASDFPLMVEGYSGPEWTKQSHGFTEATYFRGRRV